MHARVAAALLAALALAAPLPAAAGDGKDPAIPSPSPDAPAGATIDLIPSPSPDAPGGATNAPVPSSRRAGLDGPVRPILLAGAGGVAGGLTLGADLGLRFGPLTTRFAWRGEFLGSGDYLVFPSGRVGWIFAEGESAAAHVGVGAGRLTRTYDDASRGRAGSTAFVAELGALLLPASPLGPMFGVNLEVRAPVDSGVARPAVSVILDLNLFSVLAMSGSLRL